METETEKPEKNAILIQQAGGAHEALLRLAEPHHAAYCAQWGIEYFPLYGEAKLAPAFGKHPFWEKVALIKEALADGYEYVIWLDADALIVDFETDLREACEGDIGATWHDLKGRGFDGPVYNHWNCGVLYFRNSEQTRAFTERWWHTDDEGHPWRDQHAFNEALCQDAEKLTPTNLHTLGHEWNSTPPHFEAEKPVVRAWHGFGSVADKLREMKRALGQPIEEDAQALGSAAAAALMQGRKAEAEELLRRVVAQSPDEPEALAQLASLISERKEHAEAKGFLLQLVAYHPNNADAWRQLGACHLFLGEHDACGQALERAFRLSPYNPATRWNRAVWLLRDGQWREGWEQFQWGQVCGQRSLRTLGPEWRGQPIPGQTLFVWCDQGLGDTLMFVRFLGEVRKRSECARLILEVQPELIGVLRDFPGVDAIFPRQPDKGVPYAFHSHVCLMSLPGALGITQRDCGGSPYLFAEPEGVADTAGLTVGVCRSGSPGHPNDRFRSLPVDAIRPLADVPGATLVSLHPEPGNGLSDITHTARRIKGCDLVITADTMIAHLSGALGKAVWILLPKNSDYRWGKEGETTPWYSSARLFRQETLGDWGPVIDRVCEALRARAEEVKA